MQNKAICNLNFKFLLNISFLLCVTPYKTDQIDGKVTLTSYPMQKIISAMLTIISMTFSLVHLMVGLISSNLKSAPIGIFYITSYVSDVLAGAISVGTIWLKKQSVCDILSIGVNQKPHFVKVILMGVLTSTKILVMTTTILVMWFVALFEACQCTLSPSSRPILTSWLIGMKRVLTGLGYPDFAPNATKSSMEDVSSFEITLSVLCMGILLKFMGFLSGFGSALVLTSSIAMHAEVAKIWTEFDKAKGTVILEKYLLVKKSIGKINRVCGPMILSLLLYTILDVVCIPGQPTRHFVCVFIFYTESIVNITSFLIAAEGHRKCQSIEKRLIGEIGGNSMGYPPFSGYAEISTKIRSSPGENGLQGWQCFTLSYSFLGTVASVGVTYALVLLQFVSAS
ncbi:hypothetical protein Fcan01_10204 [Folsomia candida]|uniref:Gustatory receptor n=1 Tax=Folsomia candida TaxID=158441 RepID=A0A226EAW4_FOLCA|nr:hypothetical protein Fcan01_10204 [Folsomia candida]